MNGRGYERYSEDDLILRDQLAIDRTILANDRTILSFARTALTLVIAGASVLNFLQGTLWHTVGWIAVLAGPLVFIIGFMRYRRIHQSLTPQSGREKHAPVLAADPDED